LCGTELPPNSKFCGECGTRVTQASRSAEYKQVTVLFADVVPSMDIAVAVRAERLREIMTELVNRATVVVRRYGAQTPSSVLITYRPEYRGALAPRPRRTGWNRARGWVS
jgi:class 3 adenylate cyclase